MIKIILPRQAKTVLSKAVAIFLGSAMFIPVALAETPYDLTSCYYGTLTPLYKSKELTILTIDVRAIVRSNHENKVFDNCSAKSVQIIEIMNGKKKRYGHSKLLDPDGDYIIIEITGGQDATQKFLYGTGKWKGIKGNGKFERIARGKSMEPRTFQGCVRNTGTFELPK